MMIRKKKVEKSSLSPKVNRESRVNRKSKPYRKTVIIIQKITTLEKNQQVRP